MSKLIAAIIIFLVVCETAHAYLRIGRVYRPGQMLSSDSIGAKSFSGTRMRRDLADSFAKAKQDLKRVRAVLRLKKELKTFRERRVYQI